MNLEPPKNWDMDTSSHLGIFIRFRIPDSGFRIQEHDFGIRNQESGINGFVYSHRKILRKIFGALICNFVCRLLFNEIDDLGILDVSVPTSDFRDSQATLDILGFLSSIRVQGTSGSPPSFWFSLNDFVNDLSTDGNAPFCGQVVWYAHKCDGGMMKPNHSNAPGTENE